MLLEIESDRLDLSVSAVIERPIAATTKTNWHPKMYFSFFFTLAVFVSRKPKIKR